MRLILGVLTFFYILAACGVVEANDKCWVCTYTGLQLSSPVHGSYPSTREKVKEQARERCELVAQALDEDPKTCVFTGCANWSCVLTRNLSR